MPRLAIWRKSSTTWGTICDGSSGTGTCTVTVVPERDTQTYSQAFSRAVQSVRINDRYYRGGLTFRGFETAGGLVPQADRRH